MTPILDARAIGVEFGGVAAVDDLSLAIEPGEVLGLVGPNGSGKSTFLNALTGLVPARGTLEVNGRRIPLGRAGAARGAGLLRTFQTPQTFLALSCIEDVMLATADRRLTGIAAAWVSWPLTRRRERERWNTAGEALERFGLLERAEAPAAALSYGQRRRLELARAYAARPSVLLLDEPAAGLNAAETEELGRDLRAFADAGTTLLVVEHKIDFITDLCDRVAVLELGRLLAIGPADEIWQDPRVIDAYLGRDEDGAA